eukprot:8089503-Prorocentrum_lima.AAC.1
MAHKHDSACGWGNNQGVHAWGRARGGEASGGRLQCTRFQNISVSQSACGQKARTSRLNK